MLITEEDKDFIKHYRLTKNYGRKKLLKEFTQKSQSETGLRKLLNKIDDTGDSKRKQRSGITGTSRSDANIATVGNLILSQESDTGTQLNLREIEKQEYHEHLFIGLQNLTLV